ncbi:hypothetical protein NWJ10_003635 [Salmonella enterica]|uniref:hypothetical protein n=1 Tax=Enterobacteriaceae TaxID=543 RepID=UPI0015E7FFD9|nr:MULTISPECIES: hypothetical protein [Enterobacteriaceae]EFT2555379.1 hypothetical protein [Salmonella enterica]EHC7799442.1 hypothetical protein [Salmonella enterica subsp. enterica serovar Isangi]EHV9098066.1 hypothetical protein [Salmonella enterica subsp. enterica serovar Muenchen]EKR1472045.1 hypothetical protein [Salmonella enterica subsp. enterica serovar Saintpaul]EFV3485383.1 hypothetical protein [Salmonella enterica]
MYNALIFPAYYIFSIASLSPRAAKEVDNARRSSPGHSEQIGNTRKIDWLKQYRTGMKNSS